MTRLEILSGTALDARLDDVARLRLEVFREFPYLYDGDLTYERTYIQSYRESPRAVLAAAFHGDEVVGAATGTPLTDHDEQFIKGFQNGGYAPEEVFYCAESVLLPAYRGQGLGHRFFDAREKHARAHGFKYSAFCAVIRPQDHPARPADYRSLEPFWQKRGYAQMPGTLAEFTWKDCGEATPSLKQLQFYIRAL